MLYLGFGRASASSPLMSFQGLWSSLRKKKRNQQDNEAVFVSPHEFGCARRYPCRPSIAHIHALPPSSVFKGPILMSSCYSTLWESPSGSPKGRITCRPAFFAHLRWTLVCYFCINVIWSKIIPYIIICLTKKGHVLACLRITSCLHGLPSALE